MTKKSQIAEKERAVRVQCPKVQSSTVPPPLKPQLNSVKQMPLNSQTIIAEQTPHLPPTAQPPPIPSGAPTTMLTCPPPLTPAPHDAKF